MTLQQLSYILAIDQHRHFARAAEACHVTQATLSMMVQKLEAELGVKLFDRTRQPVVPTALGERVLAQARVVVQQADHLRELVAAEQEGITGEVRIGVIPTLAPYLMPGFLKRFGAAHPAVTVHIHELTTEVLLARLKAGVLDTGLLATPLQDSSLLEDVLFYEAYVLYTGQDEPAEEGPVNPKMLDVSRLWILEEGHCMRADVLSLCALNRRKQAASKHLYQAGSIETLKNLVDIHGGYTILPERALVTFSPEQQARVRRFNTPEPKREISLVYAQTYPKKKLVAAVRGVVG